LIACRLASSCVRTTQNARSPRYPSHLARHKLPAKTHQHTCATIHVKPPTVTLIKASSLQMKRTTPTVCSPYWSTYSVVSVAPPDMQHLSKTQLDSGVVWIMGGGQAGRGRLTQIINRSCSTTLNGVSAVICHLSDCRISSAICSACLSLQLLRPLIGICCSRSCAKERGCSTHGIHSVPAQ